MSVQAPVFVKKYEEVTKKKNSILSVGLDPAIPRQREKNIMPTEDRINFMETIIDLVAPYTSVIKINRQYTLGLTIDEIRSINRQIHSKQMLSVSDHKLGDIGSSNESAIFWFKEEEFDAFTFNPYSGNVLEATEMAHKLDNHIKNTLDERYKVVLQTIRDNNEAMEEMTAELLEIEVITGKRVQEIIVKNGGVVFNDDDLHHDKKEDDEIIDADIEEKKDEQ